MSKLIILLDISGKITYNKAKNNYYRINFSNELVQLKPPKLNNFKSP